MILRAPSRGLSFAVQSEVLTIPNFAAEDVTEDQTAAGSDELRGCRRNQSHYSRDQGKTCP